MWSHKMWLRQLKLQETRVKRRKEGVGESEEGARESVLSDDPPDSKYLFIYQNYRISQIPSWWLYILFSVKRLRPKSTSNVQVPDWSSRGASPCARQWLGPCRSPEVSLQSPGKGDLISLKEHYFSKSTSGDSEQHNWSVCGSLGVSRHQPCKKVVSNRGELAHFLGFVVKSQNISNNTPDSISYLFAGCERLGRVLQCFPGPPIALLNWKTTVQGKYL